MKVSKKLVLILAFVCIGLFGQAVYASEVTNNTAPSTKDTAVKENRTDGFTSDDGYVRITQPTKVNTSTFESKMNIMGETKQDTEIVIEVYNTKSGKESIGVSKEGIVVYEFGKVGITGTFNQLVELLEGENKIVIIYTNEKDKKSKEKMTFTIIRESEQTKEIIKSMVIIPDPKK